MTRYQVFTEKHQSKPVFSAPWYWVVSMYSTFFCLDGKYCRINDKKLGKTMLEWARAEQVKLTEEIGASLAPDTEK
ncbi:hypothetical protein R6242_16175 [Iodobacter sp. CM08]|uniref:hypothetical protein n=1 Tax=Iodobacter sp. CM08 TaxID=3085902 RepID=UPI00298155E1|nr:hypothetical protein [Iodobacter sp. CM08]MDW5418104.1 hypothetical protein [Iodobacter sp. CM08]